MFTNFRDKSKTTPWLRLCGSQRHTRDTFARRFRRPARVARLGSIARATRRKRQLRVAQQSLAARRTHPELCRETWIAVAVR